MHSASLCQTASANIFPNVNSINDILGVPNNFLRESINLFLKAKVIGFIRLGKLPFRDLPKPLYMLQRNFTRLHRSIR